MATTIAPSLGHAPLVTQQGIGTTPGYDAIDLRRMGIGDYQEGVMEDLSYMVVQRAAGGAAMFVDIGANAAPSANGVAAYVQGDAVTGQGLYPVPAHTAVITEAITTAHATLPRIDIVVLEILDNVHDASGSNLARVRVIAGTATSGATLANRTGAPALPSSCLLLADVLVGAAVSSITNSVIRDRRKWARGAYVHITRNSNASAADNYAVSSATIVLLDNTNLAPRIECSGAPIRVSLICQLDNNANFYFSPQVDSVGVNGMPNVGSPGTSGPGTSLGVIGSTLDAPFYIQQYFIPSAGSHQIAVGIAASSAGSVYATAGRPLQWIVEEIVRPNSRNNSVTTG